MNLNGKRILFFCAQAFGIPENIMETMRQCGATVDFFDERPANTFLVKALIRINRNLIALYINKYHRRIIEETRNIKYDYIFFIKGESFSQHNLQYLFQLHPNAKTLIYHWDSISNNPNAINLLSNFQYAFSFDKSDCDRLKMNFLPLFYFDEFKKIAESKVDPKYDLMFVGTAHSDRYRFITHVASQIKGFGGCCFIYLFFQGKIMFLKYKLQHPAAMDIPVDEVNFVPLTKKELLDLYERSRIIVDIQHPKQTGLTLRCFEALGAKKKLITTNKEIANYDFFSEANILIVDRENPKVPKSFIESPFIEIENDIYNKYSITSWVDYIFRMIG